MKADILFTQAQDPIGLGEQFGEVFACQGEIYP